MRLLDSNVWLALALSKHVHHEATREWLAAGYRMVTTDGAFARFRGLDLELLGSAESPTRD